MVRTEREKNKASFLLWLVFALVTGTALALVAVRVCVNTGTSELFGMIVGALSLILGGLMITGVRVLLKQSNAGTMELNRLVRFGLMAGIVVAGVFFRVRRIPYAGQEINYFNLAYVTSEQSVLRMGHGIVDLYILLLHLTFFIFGNKMIVAVWFQIVLQIVTALLLFKAVRTESGEGAGMISMLLYMVLPSVVDSAVWLSARTLFGLLFSLAVLGIVSFTGRKAPGWYFLCGVMVGLLTELDAAGVSLLFLFIGLVLWVRADRYFGMGERLVRLLLGLIGMISAFGLMLLREALYLERDFFSTWWLWLKTYQSEGFRIPESFYIQPMQWELLCVLGMMLVGVFGFWYLREDRFSVWLLPFCGMSVSGLCGFCSEEVPFVYVIYLIMILIAGVSMSSLFSRQSESKKNSASEFVSKDQMFSETAENEEQASGRAATEAPAQNQATQNTGMIDNPLPVPKRHKKPMLDFDIDSMIGKDFYDVKVSDDDDYDLK